MWTHEEKETIFSHIDCHNFGTILEKIERKLENENLEKNSKKSRNS